MASKKEENVNVLTNPEEMKKFKQVLVAITRDLQIIDDRKEAIKETVAEASTIYSIDKKLIRKLASVMYKSNYSNIQEENEQFELLYETLLDRAKPSKDPLEDELEDELDD